MGNNRDSNCRECGCSKQGDCNDCNYSGFSDLCSIVGKVVLAVLIFYGGSIAAMILKGIK